MEELMSLLSNSAFVKIALLAIVIDIFLRNIKSNKREKI